jgi:hypothetical protein
VAGGTTESAIVGTATDAINRLGLDADATYALLSNMAVTFVVTYFLGVITTVMFLARVAPRILRVDLAAECVQLEREMGLVTEDATATGYNVFAIRAYRVEGDRYTARPCMTSSRHWPRMASSSWCTVFATVKGSKRPHLIQLSREVMLSLWQVAGVA